MADSKTYMATLCNFDKKEEAFIKRQFLLIGKQILNKDYRITNYNKLVISDLLKYFIGNGNIDLNKGIYLYGEFGTGKTIILQIIRRLLADLFPFNPNGFGIISIEGIIEHYKKENNLTKFGYNSDDIPINLCVNEFGKEIDEKIYGTNVNSLITSLFMIRYELFQQGKLTHVTSNFNPKDLNVEPIVKDRILEMFNFIELKGESFRK